MAAASRLRAPSPAILVIVLPLLLLLMAASPHGAFAISDNGSPTLNGGVQQSLVFITDGEKGEGHWASPVQVNRRLARRLANGNGGWDGSHPVPISGPRN